MAFREKKSRSMITPPHTHTPSKHVPRDQETHTCHLTPPVCTRCHLDLLLAENRISVCHQRLFPFPQRRLKRQHAHTKQFISRPPCWKITNFEDQFCHASTSPTRLGMRSTREPPTCSQCGARRSNTLKNTPRSSEVQKKRSSTRLPCPLPRSSGNIYTFIDVPHSTRVSMMFEPEAPAKSATPAVHCSCCSACCSGWWVRTSCKTQGLMIV